jgi:hypothetical protein
VFDTVKVHVSQSTLGNLSAASSNIQQRLELETGVSCTVEAAGLSLVGSWDQVGQARLLIKKLCLEDMKPIVTQTSPANITPTQATTATSMPQKYSKTHRAVKPADSPDKYKVCFT